MTEPGKTADHANVTGVGNTYSDTWYRVFSEAIPAAQTDAEVAFLSRHLPRPPFHRLLDVGCGRGRHAVRLADAGYAVLGIDANSVAIDLARREDTRATFLVHDMRRLGELGDTFDGLVCLWQSFGYFTHVENAAVFRAFGAAVRPGGRVVLDLYHREAAAALPAEETVDRGGDRVTTRRTWNGDRMRVAVTYAAGRGTDTFEWHIYTIDEVRDLAVAAGLEVHTVCAWWDPARRPTVDDLRVQYVLERSDSP